MHDDRCMRTTLNIDDDVLRAVKEIARLRGSTAGAVMSDLARKALARGLRTSSVRNGVPLLDPTEEAAIVTPDVVDRLLDES